MGKVSTLPLAPVGPDPDVIKFLEETLDGARKGDVTGVLLLVQDANGVAYRVAGIKDRFKITGFLYHAMHLLQTEV